MKPKIEDNKGGYIIALRHSNNIISEIDKITLKVNEKVMCIKYDKTLELLDIVKENKEIGISIPISVDIGYFKLSKERFNISVYKRINL